MSGYLTILKHCSLSARVRKTIKKTIRREKNDEKRQNEKTNDIAKASKIKIKSDRPLDVN